MGLSMQLLAKLLGILSLACVGIGLFLPLHRIWGTIPALISALLVVLSGNLVWFSLSGVETMMFVALGVLALLVYKSQRWGGWGLF
jgi:hypothetical protein